MSGRWVHATHPDTGGSALFPDDASVIVAQQARGWVISGAIPPELDPDAPNLGALPVAAAAVEDTADEAVVEAVDQAVAAEPGSARKAPKRTPPVEADGNDTKERTSA